MIRIVLPFRISQMSPFLFHLLVLFHLVIKTSCLSSIRFFFFSYAYPWYTRIPSHHLVAETSRWLLKASLLLPYVSQPPFQLGEVTTFSPTAREQKRRGPLQIWPLQHDRERSPTHISLPGPGRHWKPCMQDLKTTIHMGPWRKAVVLI